MEKRNMFDLLEDSDEGELAMIDRLTPELSEEQFERILEMSKRKRNIIRASKERNNINMTTAGFAAAEVTGVEEYKRPTLIKIAATAASLILLGGGLALGHNLLKRSNTVEPDIVPNVAAVTVTTTNSATTGSENAAVTTVTADVTAEVSSVSSSAAFADSASETTAAAPQTEPVRTSVQNNLPETPSSTVQTEAISEDSNEELAKTAKRLTENWIELFRIQHAWIKASETDKFNVIFHQQYTDENGNEVQGDFVEQYYRVLAPYDTAEAIKGYISRYCVDAASDIRVTDISKVADQVSDGEYDLKDGAAIDTLYVLKDGELYCTPGMMGFNFGGWSDEPVEVMKIDDRSFVAVRKYINDFDRSETVPITFNVVKDIDGEWKLLNY
ncbi:MAG: hypothetical protein KBA55_08300 [Ruminococcus sp.]|nr:hypothetical protein [Ruminococcus sp.]